MAHLAGVRCADLGSGLRANTTSANERAGRCEAHRGPVVAGVAAQGGRRPGWAAAQAEFGGGALWWSSKRLDSLVRLPAGL